MVDQGHKIPNDPTALASFRHAIITEYVCPECVGNLDPDLTCTRCGYLAFEELVEEEDEDN